MKKAALFTLTIILIAVTVTSCQKDSNKPGITKTIVLPENGASIINANNTFAFNFLHATLQQNNDNNNKLISPLSIYLALSMVYNGAGNATKDAIAKTLQLSGININDLNAVCDALITQLPGEDGKVQFSIANSIWYNNIFQPLPSFLNIVENDYDAVTQPMNFDDPSSVKEINDWVAQKTNNKISSIIENTSSDDLMYLLNAIYFNGAWKYAFKTSDTHTDNFHLQDGSTKPASFMKQHVAVNYYDDSEFTLVELPYGSGKSYSMYIALPKNQQEPVSTFASLINESILQNAINKMDTVNIEVDMPKWEYGYSIEDMKPELSLLGMGIAFADNADFSMMYNSTQIHPYITKAIHKTYIKVNEAGTEAAAVTAIGVGLTSVVTPTSFKIDHPFLYTIIEKQTGTVLFTGIVNDPSAN